MLLLHQIVLYVSENIIQKEYKKIIKTIDDTIRDEQLQYDINKEAANTLWRFTKKCTAKPYPFLVNDLLLHQIVPYISAKIIEENYEKLIMTIGDKIRDEQLQYDVNREAAKISTLSSGKTYKYEYLTGEEILPSNQRQMIE